MRRVTRKKDGKDGQTSLSLEPLERRVLLTTLTGAGIDTPVTTTVTDASGDELELRFAAPAGATAEVVDTTDHPILAGAPDDDIGAIRFTGTDARSEFSVVDVNPGTGGNDINIAGGPAQGGVRTTDSSDMGLISLGVKQDGDEAGTTSFGVGVGVTINGSLGGFLTSGDLDFDQGATSVVSGGDIGIVSCDTLVLGGGAANITAGSGGTGNLSHLLADDVLNATGGSTVAPQVAAPGSPVVIADDAGSGTSGGLVFSAGRGSSANVWPVTLTGGGQAVARVEASGTLSIVGRRSGGDVGLVELTSADSSVVVGGAANTDLGVVEAPGISVGRVTNFTFGGDIYRVSAGGDLDYVLTGNRGNVGALLGGSENSSPIFPQDRFLEDSGVQAGGNIRMIRAGSVRNARIVTPAQVDNLVTGRGGLVSSEVEVGGDLTTLKVGYMSDSEVTADGPGVRAVVTGAVFDSDITYLGGLNRAVVRADFVDSKLSAVQNRGANPAFGGRIDFFSARGMSGSRLEAFGGLGTVVVRGEVNESEIDTRFMDANLGRFVGADIGLLSLGSMTESEVDIFSNLRLLSSGTLSESSVNLEGNLTSAVVRGDLLDSWIDVEGDVTRRLTVNGDMLEDSAWIYVDGSANNITVNGSLADTDGISVGGDAARVVITGGVSGGDDIWVGGNSTFMRVGGLDGDSGVYIDGSSDTLLIGRISAGGDVDIDGSSTVLIVERAGRLGDISIGGSAGRIFIGGDGGAIDGASNEMDVGGGIDSLTINAGLESYYVDVGGGVRPSAVLINGSIDDVGLDSEGRVRGVQVRGSVTDSYFEADSGFGSLIFRGTVSESEFDARNYDGSGTPTGGGIGLLSASGLYEVEFDLHSDLRTARITGLMDRVELDLTGRANYGSGGVVDGGRIASLYAEGLVDTEVQTYGALKTVSLGRTGMDERSSIRTFSSGSGHLGTLETSGLIFGDLKVAGNVGDIITGGALATTPVAPMQSPLDGSPVDYLFTGPSGAPTGGTLALDGTVQGTIS